MIRLNTFELQKEVINFLKENNKNLKLLNTKQDLLYNGVKGNKLFLQYAGVDYKKNKRRAVVKFVIYIVNKKITNDDDSIVKDLDNLRYSILNLDITRFTSAYIVNEDEDEDGIRILEEKYNNTDTLEFIYSLAFGINVLV